MLAIAVPANTTATVFLPGAEAGQVTEGGQAVETAKGVIQVSHQQEATVIGLLGHDHPGVSISIHQPTCLRLV
jgi:hypothetical protein